MSRAWYHLGLMYGAKGDKDEALGALDKALELSDDLSSLNHVDLQGFVIIYSGLNEWGEMADFIIKMRDLGINISIKPVYYNQALYSSILERDKDKIARLASMAVSARGLGSDDKAIILDLAEKEKLELLESILEIK